MSGLSSSLFGSIVTTIGETIKEVGNDIQEHASNDKIAHDIAGGIQEVEAELGVPCFTTGTLIRTAAGEVAVEDLAVGDLVVTASGAQRPIRWIGHRRVDCARHPNKQDALPVRIAKGAIDGARPERDLIVSPGHALCISVGDEILVPAGVLINGTTVTQIDVAEVTYWHVELDSHDIMIAEGMPTESYFDCGNRSFFVENGTVSLDAVPDAPARLTGAEAVAGYCRPLIDGGPVVEGIRDRMRHRALALGWTLVGGGNADLHLVADGVRIDADSDGSLNRFVLPATASDVWLVSETFVPRDVTHSVDRRTLGVGLGRVAIDDGLGALRTIALDDPLLSEGFHALQDLSHRWTNGCAKLPAALWSGCRGTVFLRVDLAMMSGRRWMAPLPAAAAEKRTAA